MFITLPINHKLKHAVDAGIHQHDDKMCRISDDTIEMAQLTDLYAESQIDWMLSTKDSDDPKHVVAHRGIEKTMVTMADFKSPSYQDNNEVIHMYDDNPEAIPHLEATDEQPEECQTPVIE